MTKRGSGAAEKRAAIDAFLAAHAIAVVGVSANRQKLGNVLFRELQQRGITTYPVHRTLEQVEGARCYPSVRDLRGQVDAAVTSVPPSETERVVQECADAGVGVLWMNLGSSSPAAVELAHARAIRVIEGECLLMFLEPVKSIHAVHRWFARLFGRYPR